MGKMKEVATELNLTQEQLEDKAIQKFALQVAWRKQTGEWYQAWNGNGFYEENLQNNNTIVSIFEGDVFKPTTPVTKPIGIFNNFGKHNENQ